MTRASIIEAAARAIDPEWWEPSPLGGSEPCGCKDCEALRESTRAQAAAALDAIAPPGEAWIAPWEATKPMQDVGAHNFTSSELAVRRIWGELRDAHLKETPDAP